MRVAIAVIGISILAAPTAASQRLAPSPFPSIEEQPPAAVHAYQPGSGSRNQESRPDGVAMVFAGLAGGVVGAAVGARVGGSCEDLDCQPGVVYGLAIGEAMGLAAGVHLANGGRGSLGRSVLATLAIGGGGIAAAALSDRGVVLLAVPVLQMAAAIGIERRADRGD